MFIILRKSIYLTSISYYKDDITTNLIS